MCKFLQNFFTTLDFQKRVLSCVEIDMILMLNIKLTKKKLTKNGSTVPVEFQIYNIKDV